MLSRLVETGIVREVYTEGEEERTYQPAMDTHKISVGMVFERIEAQGSEEFLQAPSAQMQAFWEKYQRVGDIAQEPVKDILVSEIMKQ